MTDYIFVFDGIGAFDGKTSNVIDKAAWRLQESLAEHNRPFVVEWVDWPAAIRPIGNASWSESTEAGVENFAKRVRQLEPQDRFVILAFSGGNRPAHVWLERVAEWEPATLDRVLAVGLASDPYRPYGKQQRGLPMPGGWGISGERQTPIMDRTFYLAWPRDVITDARHDALLRTAADVIDYFPADIIRGVQHLAANDKNFQLAKELKLFHENPLHWFFGLGARIAQAKDDIVGYTTGLHTTIYTRPYEGGPSPMEMFANTISWKVRNP